MALLIVGSIGLDGIKTPTDERRDLLGGSASYAAVAASFFSPVQLVGIVGEDFPAEHTALFCERRIDCEGLQIVPGETFRWTGEYFGDMNTRETRSIALNVFETFRPALPETYRSTAVALLANIAPDLQHCVLDQLDSPHFVIADTMDLWISIANDSLRRLMARVDMLILNDGEARQFTSETNLLLAGRKLIEAGPRFVAIKKGEHGCLLLSREGEVFVCPAFPLDSLCDPTGAGDTFAGAAAGVLASLVADKPAHEISFEDVRRAIVRGTIVASFNVEAFSLERLKSLTATEISERLAALRTIAAFD